jgi:hypothetical protein
MNNTLTPPPPQISTYISKCFHIFLFLSKFLIPGQWSSRYSDDAKHTRLVLLKHYHKCCFSIFERILPFTTITYALDNRLVHRIVVSRKNCIWIIIAIGDLKYACNYVKYSHIKYCTSLFCSCLAPRRYIWFRLYNRDTWSIATSGWRAKGLLGRLHPRSGHWEDEHSEEFHFHILSTFRLIFSYHQEMKLTRKWNSSEFIL